MGAGNRNNRGDISADVERERETDELATMWRKFTETQLREISLIQKSVFFIIKSMRSPTAGRVKLR